jgi:hypothetical protein
MYLAQDRNRAIHLIPNLSNHKRKEEEEMVTILVTKRQFEDQMDRLRVEAEIVLLTRPEPASHEELMDAVKGCTGIFARINDRIDGEIMDASGSSLKVIAEFGVGYETSILLRPTSVTSRLATHRESSPRQRQTSPLH